MNEQKDVLEFQTKFGVPMAKQPSMLDPQTFKFRAAFIQEELDEMIRDHALGDLCGVADALVDLAYVLHGTVLMMGLGDSWNDLWSEVQKANMSKVRATNKDDSKRGSSLDVIKPKGWIAPDHSKILGNGPWNVFCPQQVEIFSNENP